MKYRVGKVLKAMRAEAQPPLSQGDIEKRCGVMRCYLSRVENGHTLPNLETLAVLCEALGISMAAFFYRLEREAEEKGRHPHQIELLPAK